MRLIVGGATGKTGAEVVRYLAGQDDLQVVGAVGHLQVGADLGSVLGLPRLSGVSISASVSHVSAEADVYLDFTIAEVAMSLAMEALARSLRVLIGTSGLDPRSVSLLGAEAHRRNLATAVIPNFSIGAVLQRQMALELGRRYGRVEVVEGHHRSKRDAPSGTARDLLAALDSEGVEAAVHSLRLEGLVARQEVWAGGPGEVISVIHEVTSRQVYGAGVAMAVRQLMTASGFFTSLVDLCPALSLGD